MAMPATRFLQKRYTVGSCVLNVEWQLSALSQWYPKPVAQDLRFELWMNSEMNSDQSGTSAAGSVLVAEGDRAALQEITQYTSQNVRQLLAIASSNSPASNSPASTGRSTLPQSLQRPPSLQLTHPLGYLQLCDLNSVLHQCEQATATLPTTLSTTLSDEPSAPKANNVVPFTTLRRSIRHKPVAWASSAAAALLTVGLTTALWPSYQTSSELSATANREPGLSKVDRAQPVPNADSANPTPNAATETKPNSAANSVSSSASSSTSPSLRNSKPTAQRPSPDAIATAEQPQNAAVSQAEPSATGSTKLKAPAVSPEADALPPAPLRPTPSLNSAAPAGTPQPAQEFSTADRTGRRAFRSALEAAPPSAAQRTAESDLRTASRINTATNDAASMTVESAEAPSTVDRPTATRAGSQPEATTIAQVQRYFQTKWQESGVELSAPLSYGLQLSGEGRVVDFTALSSAAETYRDRLLPEDGPLIFSANSPTNSSATQAGAGLALRVDILPNGQVQVSKI